MSSLTDTADSFTTRFEAWRDARVAALHASDGPATLVSTHWLDESEIVPGVPGTWRLQDDGEVILSLPPDVSVTVDPLPGAEGRSETRGGDVTAVAAGAEIGPRIHLPDLTVQVTTRLGRRGARIFDHARSDAVTEVERFPPSPDWIVEATYTPLPTATTLDYGFELESDARGVPVPGVVAFELGGVRYETKPFYDEGVLLLVFADETTGQQSKPPSRFLLIDLPAAGLESNGTVTLDFNRAILPPCAFSDEFNCPLPPPGHRLGVAVTAGEQWVRWAQ